MGSQPSWPPFQPPRDCSEGFCSIYCPQWCYFLFSPPPSFDPSGSESSSGPTLSPLFIALITLAAAALILIGYYTVIYRYCHRWHRPGLGPAAAEEGAAIASHASPSDGLDESLINRITVCRYRRGDGLVGGTNCSVCLSEFREEERVRLLPKCSHAFHVQCIDTWLKSHANCPLCRAAIVWANQPLRLPPESGGNQPVAEREQVSEVAVVVQDEEASKGPSEERYDVIEVIGDGIQPIRRSFSMGSLRRGRDSFDGLARVPGSMGSLTRGGGKDSSSGSSRSKVSPHVISPFRMDRSLSLGRSCSIDHGRGRTGVLPL